MNRAIEDLRAIETERRESAVDLERRKCDELEANMAALKQSFIEKQTAEQEKMEAANEALQNMAKGETYQVGVVTRFPQSGQLSECYFK